MDKINIHRFGQTVIHCRRLTIHCWIIIVACLLFSPFQNVIFSAETNDGSLTLPTVDGRVTGLTIGSQAITFCSGLDGGFYIRENTIPDGSQIPNGCTNLIVDDPSNPEPSEFYDGAIDDPVNPYWKVFQDPLGSGTTITDEDMNASGNYVARIHIDETRNAGSLEEGGGYYGGIYRDLDQLQSANFEMELYYLTFEVKTECGWRSREHPNGMDGSVGDIETYGPHRVSARVEWFENDGHLLTPPVREPSAPYWDAFYAYGSSQGITSDNQHLTGFCGRSYRPHAANYARIVLMVEGYMPHDGEEQSGPDQVENEVLIDNIYFFKAPPIIQVQGSGLFPTSTARDLYNYYPPYQSLNMQMSVAIEEHDSYLRVAGELINTDSEHDRAIDLGFALPIKHIDSGQELRWYYDTRDSIRLSDASLTNKSMPFEYPGAVDVRPVTKSKGNIPTSTINRNHNLQVSAYPISALGLDCLGTNYGLSYGDSLIENPFSPGISHFGYRIDERSTNNYKGSYYVEFNVGLLDGSTTPKNRTQYSFIIFRSDDQLFNEQSIFRDALGKYQKDIYPINFQRPTSSNTLDWQFGGGYFQPQWDDGGGAWDEDGFNESPIDFGFRYTQGQGDVGPLLIYCASNGVKFQIYDLPWAGDFVNGNDDDEENTYSVLDTEQGSYEPPGGSGGWLNLIYEEKIERSLTIPPQNQDTDPASDQEIFAASPYRFPVSLAESPDVGQGGELVNMENAAIFDQYLNSREVGESFSGIQFDVTYDYIGNSNHLDLTTNRIQNFVTEGGRLTYSYNHFKPAIPQICTNVWYFPHVRQKLSEIDNNGWLNYGDGRSGADVQEIISVNANEADFGGSKYGIICADVIGFESALDLDFNNGSHAFNFRRAVAGDKSVARKFLPAACFSSAVDTIFAGNGTHLWPSLEDLVSQVYIEATWISLAWGFHPSIEKLVPSSVFFGADPDQIFDEYIDGVLRKEFQLSPAPAVGYTEIFRQLHLAGWKPKTGVVNSAFSPPGVPKLFIERFGPDETSSSEYLPIYLTVLNNEELSMTLTDVVDYNSNMISISELKSDLEMEQWNICEDKYGNPDEFLLKSKQDIETQALGRKKYFYLVISNLEEFTLDEGNIWGMQMVRHVGDPNVVNSPTIVADKFTYVGDPYSIIRWNNNTQLRLGGRKFLMTPQYQGEIPDKALMVFKIWAVPTVDNSDGGERGESGSLYYQRVGNWSTEYSSTARQGTMDVLPSDQLGGYALFSVDIAGDAMYDVQVAYPDITQGTSAAVCEVYLREEYYDSETGETIDSTVRGPLLTTVIDQSRGSSSSLDEDRFMSIGEITADSGGSADRLSVVVKVSSAGAEYRSGRATLVLADAVRVDRID